MFCSGLGLHGSDLDVYISLTHAAKDRGHGCKNDLLEVKKMLRKHGSKRFRNSMIVPARVSIVKLVDRNSRTRCDLNLSTRKGVLNTRFIKFCVDFDPRAHGLLVILKHFAKCHSLSGSGKGGHFSNYSIVLMVIFFLQTQSILHPLKVLQEVPGLKPVFVDGYNFAFCSDLSDLPVLQRNHCSMVDLLLGFFESFASFAFESLVISPLTGEQHLKEDMTTTRPGNQTRKIMANFQKPLVIQDPFELRVNTARNVYQTRLDRVIQTFVTAAELLRSLVENDGVEEGAIGMIFEPDFLSFKNKQVNVQTYRKKDFNKYF